MAEAYCDPQWSTIPRSKRSCFVKGRIASWHPVRRVERGPEADLASLKELLSSYLRAREQSRTAQADIEETFSMLAETWRSETRFLSAVDDIVLHSAYQSIIGMGRDAIPLLLRELQRKPSHWFWALRSITREDPVRPEDVGNIRNMTDAWLNWGRERGYL